MLTTQLSFFIPGLETMFAMGVTVALLLFFSGVILNIEISFVNLFYGMFTGMINAEIDSSQNGAGAGGVIMKILREDAVKNFILALFAVALILLILSTIVQVIRTEFNFDKGGNSKAATLKTAVKAIALFAIVPIVAVFGLFLAQFLLSVIVTTINKVLNVPTFASVFRAWADSEIGNLGASTLSFFPIDIIGNMLKLGLAMPLVKKCGGWCVGYIQRIIDCVVLFMVSAPIIAIMPLNDTPYKTWAKKFTGSVLGLFGIVISVNLCLFIISLLHKASIAQAMGIGDHEFYFNYFIMMAGIGSIDGMAALFAGLFGGNDYASSGSKLFNDGVSGMSNAMNKFKQVGALAGAITGAAIQAKKGLAAKKAAKQAQQDKLQAQKDAADKDAQQADNDRDNAQIDKNNAQIDRDKAQTDRDKAQTDKINAESDRRKAQQNRGQALRDKSKAQQDIDKYTDAIAQEQQNIADANRMIREGNRTGNMDQVQEGERLREAARGRKSAAERLRTEAEGRKVEAQTRIDNAEVEYNSATDRIAEAETRLRDAEVRFSDADKRVSDASGRAEAARIRGANARNESERIKQLMRDMKGRIELNNSQSSLMQELDRAVNIGDSSAAKGVLRDLRVSGVSTSSLKKSAMAVCRQMQAAKSNPGDTNIQQQLTNMQSEYSGQSSTIQTYGYKISRMRGDSALDSIKQGNQNRLASSQEDFKTAKTAVKTETDNITRYQKELESIPESKINEIQNEINESQQRYNQTMTSMETAASENERAILSQKAMEERSLIERKQAEKQALETQRSTTQTALAESMKRLKEQQVKQAAAQLNVDRATRMAKKMEGAASVKPLLYQTIKGITALTSDFSFGADLSTLMDVAKDDVNIVMDPLHGDKKK